MHVIRRRGWEISEREATPEHVFLNRRAFLAASGATALALADAPAWAQRVGPFLRFLYPAREAAV